MTTRLEYTLQKLWPIQQWTEVTMLIGVSGGPDSVALASALHKHLPTSSSLIFGHFNHRLRGIESDGDEQFVREMASRLDCQAIVERSQSLQSSDLTPPTEFDANTAETLPFAELWDPAGNPTLTDTASLQPENERTSETDGTSDEATLRFQRYRFFESATRQCGARYLVLGHTADDRVETSLYNLVRGTGLNGLVGIRPFRNFGCDLVLARPLLNSTRQDVLDFLSHYQLDYRIDSSNKDPKYARNRIRSEILPLLEKKVASSARASILRMSQVTEEVQAMIQRMAKQWNSKHANASTRLDIRFLQSDARETEWPILQEALRQQWLERAWNLQEMSWSHWQSIRNLLYSAPTTVARGDRPTTIALTLPGGIDVRIVDSIISIQCLSEKGSDPLLK